MSVSFTLIRAGVAVQGPLVIYIAGEGTLFISRFLGLLILKLGLLYTSRLGWPPGGRQDYRSV